MEPRNTLPSLPPSLPREPRGSVDPIAERGFPKSVPGIEPRPVQRRRRDRSHRPRRAGHAHGVQSDRLPCNACNQSARHRLPRCTPQCSSFRIPRGWPLKNSMVEPRRQGLATTRKSTPDHDRRGVASRSDPEAGGTINHDLFYISHDIQGKEWLMSRRETRSCVTSGAPQLPPPPPAFQKRTAPYWKPGLDSHTLTLGDEEASR